MTDRVMNGLTELAEWVAARYKEDPGSKMLGAVKRAEVEIEHLRDANQKPSPETHVVGDHYELLMRLQAVQHGTDRPYAASVAKDAGDAIKALVSRLADMTTERDNLSTIVASGIDEVAGAALDAAEETIARLLAPSSHVSDENPMRFFSENVDKWGAAEWFNRLANAIREQDRAVIAKDEISIETYRMIAASSAMTLVRDHEATVRTALATEGK